MCKQNTFRKFLILCALAFFSFAIHTAMRVTPAQAQQCPGAGTACISPNSLADALDTIYTTTISPGIQQAQAIVIAYMIPLVATFDAGMGPILDWSNRQLSDFFDTYWYYNILPPMQMATRELSTAITEQSYALGAFADAANLIRMARVVGLNASGKYAGGDIAIEDHRAMRPSGGVCTAGTLMGGLARATAFSDGFNAASAAEKLWRSANRIDKPSHAGTAFDLNWRWGQYVQNWCNKDYNNGFAGCATTAPFAGQDVDVANLVFGQDTIPLTPADVKGQSPTYFNLQELVTNLAEPYAKDPVTADPAHGGKLAILQSVSYKTKRQIAYDGLDYVISRRVPGGLNYQSEVKATCSLYGCTGLPYPQPDPTGTPPTYDYAYFLWQVRALTGEEGPQPNSTNVPPPLLGSDFTSPNPSRNEVLRALITQRYRSGQYSLGQIDEPENNRREMVIDEALQLIQMSDELDIMDHQMLLLASQVSTEVEQEHGLATASEGAPLK